MDNFRAGQTSALSYGIECDLDHQMSYLNTMLRALGDANPHWDFAMRAQHELRDLQEYKSRIEAIELPENAARPLRRYTDATERLLREILRDVAEGNGSPPYGVMAVPTCDSSPRARLCTGFAVRNRAIALVGYVADAVRLRCFC